MTDIEIIRPTLPEPFPDIPDLWKDPITGLKIPKKELANITYRKNLLQKADKDPILQRDLMAASAQSILFWVNAFLWTHHQWDISQETGERIEAVNTHVPFISWEIQDEAFRQLEWCLRNAKDILFDKSRDMGATWLCIAFIHHKWLFRSGSQITEMSRIEDDVDKPGNEKALFYKHDYINKWLPEWMLPSNCLEGQKYRTRMHMENHLNGNVIDGESTTKHAGRGSRRAIMLLDEFAAAENGSAIRTATRDTALMRIVNSTVGGPGTEYSRWKKSGQIKVFVLPYYEHPEKGRGRYIKQNDKGEWEIRSPWFDNEEKIRPPKDLAKEVLRQDVESGDTFFSTKNIDKHIALYGREPKVRLNVKFIKGMTEDKVHSAIMTKDFSKVEWHRSANGQLRVWTNLVLNRPEQNKSYIFGVDTSKGQGASNSVISIKCKETGEKIAEWTDANVPPYEFAYIVAALAIWCGGCKPRGLPFLKWENNGPGWDLGRLLVKKFFYPYFYRRIVPGKTTDKKTESYGFHTDSQSKYELLALYDKLLANGGYINHSIEALNEAKEYIYFSDGTVGPASLTEESPAARKTHGDRTMADALTLDNSDIPRGKSDPDIIPKNSFGGRFKEAMTKKNKKTYKWQSKFDFAIGRV